MYNYRKAYGMVPKMVDDMNRFFYDDNWSNISAPVNIKETDNTYEIHVVAPGLNKEDFKITVDENKLKISYEHKQENKEQQDKWLRNEYRHRSFKRSFTLSDKVSAEGIHAKYTDGILNVVLPKKEQTAPATKEISVA
jgi:HSP20 family protein